MGFKVARIQAGQTKSDPIELQIKSANDLQDAPVGVVFPASMLGTGFSFEVSFDGTNWVTVMIMNGGSVYAIQKTNNSFVPIDPRCFIAVRKIRLVSTTTETSEVLPLLVFAPLA